MKAGNVTYSTKELVSLNKTDAFIVLALEKKFGEALQIQGLQANGKRVIWVYKHARNAVTRNKLRDFILWVNHCTEYTATRWTDWGATIQKDASKNIRYFLPPAFVRWHAQVKEEVEANAKLVQGKEKLFEPKTPIGYKLGGKGLIVSQWGTIYVPHPFKRVGKVCGSTKTRTGNPCKRWCNTGHCKGH